MSEDREDVDDVALSTAPEFVAGMAEADAEIESGERGKPLDDLVAELDAD